MTVPAAAARRERSDAPSDSAANEPRTFEAAFTELQQVVEQLEDGGLDLDRAIQSFERGTRLAQICERFVDAAELRVTRLTAESPSPLSEATPDS